MPGSFQVAGRSLRFLAVKRMKFSTLRCQKEHDFRFLWELDDILIITSMPMQGL